MRALSLVEKGWAGARWLSIDLARQGTPVTHLVRGTIPQATREVLTPTPGISIVGVSPRLYRVAAWFHLWVAQTLSGVGMVITDNAKTAGWVRSAFPELKERVLLVAEGENGKPQILERGNGVRLP